MAHGIKAELTICTDCLIWHANADTTGIDNPERERAVRGVVGLDPADRGWVVVGEQTDTFSSAPCDTCGTRLAGERHQAFILTP